MSASTSEISFLDGRVVAVQPQGFRSGLDAVMLAAAVPARDGESALELGAGAGVAGLCLLARVPGMRLTGVEIDSASVALARANAAANGVYATFAAADIFDLPPDLKHTFDHVFCNPPFHHAAGQTSPDPLRARALADAGAEGRRLGDWLALGLKRTVSDGTLTAILRADRLAEALAVLPGTGTVLFPLWPRAGAPARRIIVRARKGSGAAPVLAAGLVLHRDDGDYTPQAQAVLRGGAALALT